jgi:hypothetical protein
MFTQQIPAWVITVVGIANFIQIFSALALIIIAFCMVLMLKNMLAILKEMRSIVETEVRKEILPSVSGTLKNVKLISDDAAATTHNVTSAANRVSNLVGSAATRIESPVIRAVGMAAGLLAGLRSVKGGKSDEKSNKKRWGFFG